MQHIRVDKIVITSAVVLLALTLVADSRRQNFVSRPDSEIFRVGGN
jgi:hypothetical protein